MSAILFALIVCDPLPSYGNQPLMTWPFSNLSVYDPQCFANVLNEILYNCQWWRSVSLKQLLLVYSRPILSHSTLRKLGKMCSNARNCAPDQTSTFHWLGWCNQFLSEESEWKVPVVVGSRVAVKTLHLISDVAKFSRVKDFGEIKVAGEKSAAKIQGARFSDPHENRYF